MSRQRPSLLAGDRRRIPAFDAVGRVPDPVEGLPLLLSSQRPRPVCQSVINFSDPQRRSLTRDDQSAFAAPSQFGPFRVLHQIGVGALGPVFRTYEPDRDRLVAVKAFRLDITPEQAQSLASELARAAETGLFHPSIVEPITAGVQGTVAYNAEEYVAAESLDVAMRHYAPAPIETVRPFITQLAGAIDFARVAGVGHGALHPRDIFMTPDEARVTGFGVVEALERVGLRAPVRRPYSPPERIAGAAWSTPADVFSLAAVTYELLTGRRPAGLGGEIGNLTTGTQEAGSQALHKVLAKAMDENPSARYPTALAFASALEAASHGEAPADAAVKPAPARAPVAPPPAAPPSPAQAGARPVPAPPIPAAPVAGQPAAKSPASTPNVAPPPAVVVASPPPSTAAAPPPVASPPPGRKTARTQPKQEQPKEDDDDVAIERDEDDAHHQLTLHELDEARRAREERRDDEIELDEDIAVEAEADRYAADDFLLDAAHAASSPRAQPSDRFRSVERAIDTRAPEDDEVMADESSSRVFRPDDLLSDKRETEARTAVYAAPLSHYTSADDEFSGEERRSSLALILTLVLGLLTGLGGGYWLWGRSAASGGREFSEQAINPSAQTAATTPPPSAPAASPAVSPTPTAGKSPASAAKPTPAPETPGAPAPAESRTPPRATTGTVVVRSTPTGAGVMVNGTWRGRTPLTLDDLPFARYDVRVVQPGYRAAQEAVALSAAEPSRSLAFRLEQQPAPSTGNERATPRPSPSPSAPTVYTGTVFVDSRPRNARIFIDGKAVGATPATIPHVRVGSHVVRLELPDHRIWSTTATVTAGQQSRVTGSLERIQ